MLHKINSLDAAGSRKLMDLYYEGNLENTDYFYPEITDKKLAIEKVEKDFLKYLDTDFFSSAGNVYWVLEDQTVWVSALRLYQLSSELYYIEALETHPEYRHHGYASKLLDYVIEELKSRGPFRLCDCVGKKNTASLKTHEKCGFAIVSEEGFDYLSNTADKRDYGMQYSYLIDSSASYS